jgi:hypothetical protein
VVRWEHRRKEGSTAMFVYQQPQLPQQPEWLKPLLWIGAGLLLAAIVEDSESGRSGPTCSVCGVPGHNRVTCPHYGQRVAFSRSIPHSSYCECCGQSSNTHRHHTRGRADDSDFLDVCTGCHLTCCHDGDFNNIGIKPRTCRFSGRQSCWRRYS